MRGAPCLSFHFKNHSKTQGTLALVLEQNPVIQVPRARFYMHLNEKLPTWSEHR